MGGKGSGRPFAPPNSRGAQLLHRRLRSLHMSITDAAAPVGVAVSTLSRWVVHGPSDEGRERLSIAFRIPQGSWDESPRDI